MTFSLMVADVEGKWPEDCQASPENEAIALTSRCKVREARRSIGRRPRLVGQIGWSGTAEPPPPPPGLDEAKVRRGLGGEWRKSTPTRSLTRQRGNHLRKISVQQRTSENRVSIVVATSAIRFSRGRSQLPDPVSRPRHDARAGPPEIARQHAAAVEITGSIIARRVERAPPSSVGCFFVLWYIPYLRASPVV